MRFEGADGAFPIWVNGKEVGYTQGSRNASEFDITAFIRSPGSNYTIAVRVYEFCDGSYLERQDQWLFLGIFKDVYLLAFPLTAIIDFSATPEIDKTFTKAVLRINLTTQGDTTARASIKLRSPEGIVIKEGMVDGEGRGAIRIANEDLRLWSVEDPVLYTLTLTLAGSVISQRIGFRRIELCDSNTHINGKPIILYGVSRHEHYHTFGRAGPYESMWSDLILMKRSNINAIRCSLQPNDPRFYDLWHCATSWVSMSWRKRTLNRTDLSPLNGLMSAIKTSYRV